MHGDLPVAGMKSQTPGKAVSERVSLRSARAVSMEAHVVFHGV